MHIYSYISTQTLSRVRNPRLFQQLTLSETNSITLTRDFSVHGKEGGKHSFVSLSLSPSPSPSPSPPSSPSPSPSSSKGYTCSAKINTETVAWSVGMCIFSLRSQLFVFHPSIRAYTHTLTKLLYVSSAIRNALSDLARSQWATHRLCRETSCCKTWPLAAFSRSDLLQRKLTRVGRERNV